MPNPSYPQVVFIDLKYRTHTKFRGINFRALAGSEFYGSIFSCGVIFVDTRCSRSEINFQLRSYTVKKIKSAYHTNGVLYDTVGVLITLIKV